MPTGDPVCPQHGMVPCWCGDATRAVTRKCYNCGPGAPRDTDEKWLCARCSGVYMFLPSGKMESIARWQRTTGIPRVESAHRTVDSEGDRLRGPGQRGGTGTFIDGSTSETQGSNADPLHAEGKAESPSVSALLTLQEGLKEYGQHKDGCDANRCSDCGCEAEMCDCDLGPFDWRPEPCTCGFSALLSSLLLGQETKDDQARIGEPVVTPAERATASANGE
jgi:hypothetical protein